MKKISSYLSRYASPTSGFSEGKLMDNPGDDTGSGITVQTHNDFLYGFYAFIKKFLTGGLSDTDESETNSDFTNAFDEALGRRVDGVDDWSAAVSYTTPGESATKAGIQFVNINATGNLNKNPLTQPLFWLPVPDARVLFFAFRTGKVVRSESHPLHDYNNDAYQQYFSLGRHKIGGASGTVLNAWGIHLDGSTITPGSTLDEILGTWFLQTTFAPGSPKVLVDARETFDRSVGAAGGQADTIGARQEDQLQGFKIQHTGGAGDANGNYVSTTNDSSRGLKTNGFPVTDGVNGDPRTGSETRPKALVSGVPYMVIMAEDAE